MLGLKASGEVRRRLRSLRDDNPELFALVAASITSAREGERAGATFRLEDGRTAYLLTFFDFTTRTDFALVWTLDESDGDSAVLVIEASHL